jgi:uncharacterized RDD family membrane protein YckC
MNSSSASPGGPPRGPQFDNRRIAAGVIDLVLVAVVAAVIMFAAGVLGGGETEMTGALQIVVLAWALFYYFAMESGAGQTVGKRAMGLRVLMVDGQRAGYGEIGVRTALRVIDGIAFYLVGLIVMLVTGERRQRLGDLAAKTCVTSADWQPAGAAAPTVVPAAAVAVPSSAIVLPTAPVEPAGTAFETPVSDVPEAPDVPSPFTPFEEPSMNGNGPEHAPVEEPPIVEPAPPVLPVAEEPPIVEEPPVAEPALPPAVPVAEEPPIVEPAMPPAFPVADEPPVVEPAMPPAFPAAMDEPAIEEPPVVEEPVVEASLPPAFAPVEEPAAEEQPAVPEPSNGVHPDEREHEDEPAPDERVRVRTVETLSAMDLLMSEIEEDDQAGRRSTG